MKDQTYTVAGQLYTMMLQTLPKPTNREKQDPNFNVRRRAQDLQMMEGAILQALTFERMANNIGGTHESNVLIDQQMDLFKRIKDSVAGKQAEQAKDEHV